MPITIADLSRLALYLNAITSWILLAKILTIRLYRFYPVIALVMLLDMISASLFGALGPDSKVVSEYSRYMSLSYAVLYVFAATEIFQGIALPETGVALSDQTLSGNLLALSLELRLCFWTRTGGEREALIASLSYGWKDCGAHRPALRDSSSAVLGKSEH
jgi:hypothetical protein